MRFPLPSKHMILNACSGTITIDHPVLRAARQLAELHRTREHTDPNTIDSERSRLVCRIDAWVAAMQPTAMAAAYLHSETIGMIVDRLARLSVLASATDQGRCALPRPGHARDRLAELADAYGDLVFEISRGTRRLPRFPLLESPCPVDLPDLP